MKKIRRFLGLSFFEKKLFIQAFILLAIVKLGLWGLSFQTLLKITKGLEQWQFRPSAPLKQMSHHCQGEINCCVQMIDRATWYMPGRAKCLARALTAQILLRRLRYPTELRIGVKKGSGKPLEAHAWVELYGQVIIGQVSELTHFIPFSSLTPAVRLD